MKDKSSQAGYTMVESILYIGLISVVVVSIMSLVHKAYDKYRISRIVSQVSELETAVFKRCVAAQDYSNCSADYNQNIAKMLCSEGLVPGDVGCKGDNGDEIYHRYGGQITFSMESFATLKLAQGSSFSMTFTNVPSQACVDLLRQNWKTSPYATLVVLTVNGTICKWRNVAANECSLPVSMSQITTFCSGNNNSIKWTFQ